MQSPDFLSSQTSSHRQGHIQHTLHMPTVAVNASSAGVYNKTDAEHMTSWDRIMATVGSDTASEKASSIAHTVLFDEKLPAESCP